MVVVVFGFEFGEIGYGIYCLCRFLVGVDFVYVFVSNWFVIDRVVFDFSVWDEVFGFD